MHKKATIKLLTPVTACLAALVMLAAPAAASTWTSTIVPSSSITLTPNLGAPQTFPLGQVPTTTPPANCNVGSWSPSTLPAAFDSDAAPTTVSTSGSFNPGAQNITVLGGWKRIEITNVNFSGSVNPTSGNISNLTGSATVTFKDCSPGQPTECVIDATASSPAGTGSLSPVPPVTSSTTATISASGTLSTHSGCGFAYILGLSGAAFNFNLTLDL